MHTQGIKDELLALPHEDREFSQLASEMVVAF